ncbi:YhcN/YlaJ family sporulation lipoprotein [Niallia sp. Krafla_26]|uniref:YhcN/YlaJ family sporulation lipoprotein n=1 Tax=Niallia sp. Krafla_26 TaxID=3064703 RepID=UPI003D182434
MKKGLMLVGATVLSLSLTGCGGDDNAAGINNNGNNQSNEVRPIANYNNNNNNNNDRNLRISDRAERQVERLNEVDDAHVIISNNNAYVTVRLANDKNTNNRTNNANMNTNNNNTRGTGNFLENGTVNQNGNDGIINGRGDAGTRDNRTSDPGTADNARIRTNNDNDGLGTRNNMNNTNTRGNGTNYSEVSNSFEQKIADQVRQADKNIHNVYVSVNPDLYNRMNTFADDIRTNRNRDGLFDDFSNTINDFFGRGNTQ